MKSNGFKHATDGFMPIHMPKNTAAGMVISGLSAAFGFAMVWHMWLIGGLTFAALMIAIIAHTFNYKRDYYIPAEEVEQVESKRTEVLA
jgi:cytochrome o ubiquinol oxidase subunit 1